MNPLLDIFRKNRDEPPPDDEATTAETPGGGSTGNSMLLMLAFALLAMILYFLFSGITAPPDIQTPQNNPPPTAPVQPGDPFASGEPIFAEEDTPVPSLSLDTPIGTLGDDGQSEYVIAALTAPIHDNVSSFPVTAPPDSGTVPVQIPVEPPPLSAPGAAPAFQPQDIASFAGADDTTAADADSLTNYVDPSHHLMPGAVVPAILTVEVNSDFASGWVGQVSHPVFDINLRNLLVPAGSTVTGTVMRYNGENEIIRDTVVLAAQTITRPDGAIIPVNVRAGDGNGQGAIAGETDSHFWTRSLGTAAFAIFSILPSLTADNGPAFSARDQATGEIAAQAGAQVQPLAQRYAQLVPTTILPPGTRMRLLIDRPIAVEPYAPARTPMRFGGL